jgi:DNA-directed RNA polymerase subunit RPC12/RpoP
MQNAEVYKMNYIQVNCPHCGKELPIPEDAETITCMYCAQSIDVHALLNPNTSTEPQEDFCELLAQAKESLPDDLFNQRTKMQNIAQKTYPDLFQKNCKAFRPALEKFDRACRSAANSEEAIDRFAETLLNRFEEVIVEDGIKKPSNPHFYNYAYMLISLFIPTILEYQSDFSEPLVDAFLSKWKVKYPKNPIGKATYEDINSGFRKKWCFITTAVCQTLNKPDDCYELNAFRGFRDNWLAQAEDGKAKIQEYYLFAPLIVQAINASPRKEEVYRGIWKDYLAPCLTDIEQNRQQSCAKLYEKMVKNLELEWLN